MIARNWKKTENLPAKGKEMLAISRQFLYNMP